MNLLEQQLDYPWGDALPAPGTAMEVAPGIKWLRMGLPFALDHINLWLLRDRLEDPRQPGRWLEGWSVVDCCISSDASRAQWEAVFAAELDGLPILRVIVTHMHPDHIGLAHWLCERWTTASHACRLWISATDYHAARLASQSASSFGGEAAAQFFASHGLADPVSLATIRERTGYYSHLVPEVPACFSRLTDGHVLDIGGRRWTCIAGYGHAPEHMALHCEELEVLISGDMVLPRISTNVSVYDLEPEANALSLFLASIDRFMALQANTLTLPSHGKPFRGLHTRIGQLHDHHRDRLAEVLQACGERPCSGADILPIMFRRTLDMHQTTFAMGEAVAHLHLLWLDGRLQRRLGADNVYRFSTP
ncbi:MAG: fold metallo-hydrolase [Polaromonas sp.]|nr:fold metallo-hydrolase [Polaromonas sp.]